MTNKKQIRQKLRVANVTIGTSDTDLFSSNVPENKMRNIVLIMIIGDGSASTTVDIEKKGEDGTYTVKIPSVPIAPADIQPIPPSGFSIEDPVIVLEGGTNLAFKAASGSPKAAVVYWDE